jgi:S-formylglutathione hydrolase FrmB
MMGGIAAVSYQMKHYAKFIDQFSSAWGLSGYASSTSIFFADRSSFVMRNLRICPGWIACGFDVSATAPLFHFAESMELNDARSG